MIPSIQCSIRKGGAGATSSPQALCWMRTELASHLSCENPWMCLGWSCGFAFFRKWSKYLCLLFTGAPVLPGISVFQRETGLNLAGEKPEPAWPRYDHQSSIVEYKTSVAVASTCGLLSHKDWKRAWCPFSFREAKPNLKGATSRVVLVGMC